MVTNKDWNVRIIAYSGNFTIRRVVVSAPTRKEAIDKFHEIYMGYRINKIKVSVKK